MTQAIMAQKKYIPFSEARNAINRFENGDTQYDSLRGVYHRRWVLEITYGQRFISAANKTSYPDTITFADFTKRRSFFGTDIGYFLKPNLYIGMGLAMTLLPKSQEVSSISIGSGGISGEGKGNGGAMLHIGAIGKYYFSKDKYSRPYAALELGQINLLAKGGSISFSSNSGQNGEIQERRVKLPTGQISLGISHRVTPVWLVDFNVGYLQTARSKPIAGITSPGGFTTSLSMQFIFNPRKK